MKKFFLFPLVIVLLFTANQAIAQLESGTIAPNFTATDINGNTYELYEVLAEGKTVILDVFATWCPPCWSYHQDHILEDLYQQYGPDGTNELMVFGIEADGTTSAADLRGETSESLGNWLSGISYPMIDDAAIGNLYEIGYFPTVYHICEGRIVTETAAQLGDYFVNRSRSCASIGGVQNVNVEAYIGYQGTICGTEVFAPAVKIQNLSESPIDSIGFALSINGEVRQEMMWAGTTLAPYALTDISFNDITTEGNTEITIEIVSINGSPVDGEMPNGNAYTVTLEQAAFNTEIIYLEIQTDEYAYENYWELTDEEDNVVASGGNPKVGMGGLGAAAEGDAGSYPNSTLVVEEIAVGAGCYFFTMYDDYADGMCCTYGNGYYSIIDENGTELLRGEEFEASKQDKFFNLNSSVAVEELESVDALNVNPNPASTSVQVAMELRESASLNISIFNNLGQQLKTLGTQQYTSGSHQLQLEVQDLPNGVYFVNLQSEAGTKTKRFVVQH